MKISVAGNVAAESPKGLEQYTPGLYYLEEAGYKEYVLLSGTSSCMVMVSLTSSFWWWTSGSWSLRKLKPCEIVTLNND